MSRPWSITWAGQTWTDETPLTVADLCRLQVLVGDSWGSADPWASPLHLLSMVAVLLAKVGDVDPVELLPVLQQAPADVFVGALQPRVKE